LLLAYLASRQLVVTDMGECACVELQPLISPFLDSHAASAPRQTKRS
jgi:hypothetical protein